MAEEIIAVFSGRLRAKDYLKEYAARSQVLTEIVASLPGFISQQAFSFADGRGGRLVRFEFEEALDAWREHPEHVSAKEWGKAEVLASYTVDICRVVHSSTFER